MSVSVELLEKSMAKLTIEVPVEEVAAAEQRAYLKNRDKIAIPGFRKGKAPRSIIAQLYGPDVFMEDAVNDLLPDAYEKACKESGLEITSRPEIAFEQVEHGKPLIVTATVAVRPEVTLGQYRGLEVPAETVEVSDDEIMAEIAKEQEKNATLDEVEGRPVEEGDTVNLDYAGTVDGVAFAGGIAEEQELVIGSHSFIEGFEEQMIGMEIGEEKDLNVTFPEKYHAEELAGKPAVFHVKVNSISRKNLPEIDDEFASEVSEFDTLEAYKASVRENLLKKKEDAARARREDALLQKAVENAQMEIAEPMIEAEAENMLNGFEERLQMQGLQLDQYMKFTGQTKKQLIDQYKEPAGKQVAGRLVLEAIAKAEGFLISEEEMTAKFEEMSKQYDMEVDKIKSFMDEDSLENLKKDMLAQKALNLLVSEAK
ncbi:MAG: trigger factor [Lachnospiraceae bacterium]|nr:trigger factor [Lachnospiraceae bacterium]